MPVSERVISFARGAPSPDIVPVEALEECAARAFRDPQAVAALASYGNSAGYPPLREWLAEWHGVEPAQVILTNGSIQADYFFFAEMLARPGTRVFVEQPSYDRTLAMLAHLGADIVPVPVEADGLNVDALHTALLHGPPSFVHVIPNFHNPAGCTLAESKRRELVNLAHEHGFTVFEDDPYVEVGFEVDEGVPPRMLDLDTGHRVVYASSFSKTVAPGMRVGYLIGSTELVASLTQRAVRSYIMPAMFSQIVVNEFCRSGAFARNVDAVIAALRERRDALADALRAELPEFEFALPGGGYFLWARMPASVDVNRLADAAGREGVRFVKGSEFYVRGADDAGDGGAHELRLAFAGVTPEEIREGVSRLRRAYERAAHGRPQG